MIDNSGLHVLSVSVRTAEYPVAGKLGFTGGFTYNPPEISANGQVGIPGIKTPPTDLVYIGGGFSLLNGKLDEAPSLAAAWEFSWVISLPIFRLWNCQ